MALAWVFTLPIAAVVGGLAGKLASGGNAGTVVVALVAVAIVVGIYIYSRRQRVTSHNVNDEPNADSDRSESALAAA